MRIFAGTDAAGVGGEGVLQGGCRPSAHCSRRSADYLRASRIRHEGNRFRAGLRSRDWQGAEATSDRSRLDPDSGGIAVEDSAKVAVGTEQLYDSIVQTVRASV